MYALNIITNTFLNVRGTVSTKSNLIPIHYSRAKSNDVASWLSAWNSGMEAISKYGGAEPGDRTMVNTELDTLINFINTL